MTAPTTNPPGAYDLIKQGIALYKAGDKLQAGRQFYQATQVDPTNQLAWLWLAGCIDEEQDQRHCFEQVVAINPQSEAGQRAAAELAKLQMQELELPPPLSARQPAQQEAQAAPEPAQTNGNEEVQPQASHLIEQFIAHKTFLGWQVVNRTETSAQLKKPRTISVLGMIVFVVLPAIAAPLIFMPLLTLAIIGFILVMMHYFAQQEELLFVTLDDLLKQQQEHPHK
jgi:tetratricopeptide (TPR) repeat protein